jgi:hypothetical protein
MEEAGIMRVGRGAGPMPRKDARGTSIGGDPEEEPTGRTQKKKNYPDVTAFDALPSPETN